MTEQDFLSHTERVALGLARLRRNASYSACELAGTSVFEQYDQANRMRELFGPMRNKQIAAGSLASSGVVKRTNPSSDGHHTWWRPEEDNAWSSFEAQEKP